MVERDIEKYKNRLLSLRSRLTGEVERIIEAVQQEAREPGRISNVPVHPADQAQDGIDVEVDILHNEQDILKMVEDALDRVSTGTFGLCQRCGRTIADARLEAMPYTPYCVNCAGEVERIEGRGESKQFGAWDRAHS